MRSLRKLLVLLSMVVVISMLSMGVAFAHPVGAEDAFTANGLNNRAPVGSNALDPDFPGGFNGFFNDSNAFDAIAANPLCPAHHPQNDD